VLAVLAVQILHILLAQAVAILFFPQLHLLAAAAV
jgi:hypothetical protein